MERFKRIIDERTKTLQHPGSPNTSLEDAAQECMSIAANSSNIWVALIAQNCALAIRSLPNWLPARSRWGKECEPPDEPFGPIL